MDSQIKDGHHSVHVKSMKNPPKPLPVLNIRENEVTNGREESNLEEITLALPDTFFTGEPEDMPAYKDEE